MKRGTFKSRLVIAFFVVASGLLAMPARPADAPLRTALPSPLPGHGSAARQVSRQEIYAAIQNDLGRKGIAERAVLRPEDLSIQALISVHTPGAGLEVKRTTYDPFRRTTVFELWVPNEPEYLPFAVTTRGAARTFGLMLPGQTRQAAGRDGSAAGNEAQPNQTSAKPPVLAKPGTPSTLIMYGANVRITTSVMPLQPGIKGQRILVRDPVTSRILAAEVAGAGLLQASF